MRKFIFFLIIFSHSTIFSSTTKQHSFKTSWTRYRLEVSAHLMLHRNVNVYHRQELRRDTLDRVWEIMSPDFENLIIDRQFFIKDLLETNQAFSLKYSNFFQNLSLGSIRLMRSELSTKISIPLRGKGSLLEILPLPWATERYGKLSASEPVSNFYENQDSGEYPESLAPVIYTGLIVDVRGQKFNPSLAPRIYDPTGRLLYGPEFVAASAGIARGVAGFTTSLVQRESSLRAGRSPLLAVSMAAMGDNFTDAVISNADAKRLFEHKKTLKNLLGCRVVFLYDPKNAAENSFKEN